MAHQNRRADRRNEMCWAAWTHSLVSVAWNSDGACQPHRTTAWIDQAENGWLTPPHVAFHPAVFENLARPPATGAGSARRKAIIGLPSTISGAASSINISCCTM